MVTTPTLSNSGRPTDYMPNVPFPLIVYEARTIADVMAGRVQSAPKRKVGTLKKLSGKKVKASIVKPKSQCLLRDRSSLLR